MTKLQCFLIREGLYEQVIRNVLNDKFSKSYSFYKKTALILRRKKLTQMFSFSDTPEGLDFWYGVHEKYMGVSK